MSRSILHGGEAAARAAETLKDQHHGPLLDEPPAGPASAPRPWRPPPRSGPRRAPSRPGDTVKLGILHSLSGTMAISETTLKDVMLMLIDEAEQEGRRARPEARSRGGRPRVQLAALRREGPRADLEGRRRGLLRLLDLRVAQVRAAGVQGARQHPVLPRPVRGRGMRAQRVLHGRRPEPAGHPRRRLPDERRRRLGEALGAGRHRLRLPTHHQQDPRSLPQAQGRGARRHHDQLHAIRPVRLADHRLGHQEVRLGRQEDRRGVDHQRRRQRALL